MSAENAWPSKQKQNALSFQQQEWTKNEANNSFGKALQTLGIKTQPGAHVTYSDEEQNNASQKSACCDQHPTPRHVVVIGFMILTISIIITIMNISSIVPLV